MRAGGRGPDNPNTPRAKRNVFTTSELLMSSNYKNRRRYLSLDNAYLKKCLFAIMQLQPFGVFEIEEEYLGLEVEGTINDIINHSQIVVWVTWLIRQKLHVFWL